MKNCIKVFVFLFIYFSTSNIMANNNTTIGLGIGTLYNGLGINLAWRTVNDMKYVSMGCTDTDFESDNCGYGVGWVTTELFDTEDNRHALGIWVGRIEEVRYFNTNRMLFEEEIVYGGAISYQYFSNGIDKPGMNFGFGVNYGEGGEADINQYWLNLGYQF